MVKPLIADHLLFPDVLWHLPQNVHQRKGQVLFVGGPQASVHPLVEAAEICVALGVKEVIAALSETVASQVQGLLPELTVVGLPETPTNSLSLGADRQLIELATATDVCLLGFSLTKQAETQQLIKDISAELETAAVFFEDGLEAIAGDDLRLRKRPSLLIGDAGSLGRFLKRSNYVKAGDRPMIEHLYKDHLTVASEATSSFRTSLVLTTPEPTCASPDSRVTVTPGLPPEQINRNIPVMTGLVAGLAAHQPAKLFECSATAITIFARLNESDLFSSIEKKRQIAGTLPAILLELEKQTI